MQLYQGLRSRRKELAALGHNEIRGTAYVGEGQPWGAADLGSNPATGLTAAAMLARPRTTLVMKICMMKEV